MQSFSERVLAWFEVHGRKQLPWQQDVSAYKTWISEIMLQQTQVTTVIPYFNRFMVRFPDVITLANAHQDDVLAHWAGLGYYSRARNLHKSAQTIRDKHDGVFPTTIEDVMALSGIGKSTAGAILSLARQQRHAILDGNVKRVLSRHQLIDGIPNQSTTLKKQWAVAEQFTPERNCDQYTQAMMDLGAMICTRTKPQCQQCPVHIDCGAYQNNKIADYPNKKPKKAKPARQTFMAIVRCRDDILMEKRPNSGIWGGLYGLPMFDDIPTFTALFGETGVQRQGIIHPFTHFTLHITPRLIELPHKRQFEHYQWISYTDIEHIGLPKPVQTLINTLSDGA